MADKLHFDFTGLKQSLNIGLGDGVAGRLETIDGKRYLIALVNLDHAPLPISDGQLKYANEHPVKDSSGKMVVRPPTPYIAKGGAVLETNHQVSITAKPVKARTNKVTGGLD